MFYLSDFTGFNRLPENDASSSIIMKLLFVGALDGRGLLIFGNADVLIPIYCSQTVLNKLMADSMCEYAMITEN